MLRALLFLALAASASAQTHMGRLEPGDDTLNSGEFMDEYVVTARAGQTVSAVVTSDAFDTYVIVKSESGEQADDDDCTDGETTRSCAALAVGVDGPVRVLVTSFAVGEAGPYRVEIRVADSGGADGRLEPGDATLGSGELFDRHPVALAAGERATLTLTSAAFGPYLIVQDPHGGQHEAADCGGGDAGTACVSVVADRAGTWEVFATSVEPGATGPYRLAVDRGEAGPLGTDRP